MLFGFYGKFNRGRVAKRSEVPALVWLAFTDVVGSNPTLGSFVFSLCVIFSYLQDQFRN